MRFIQVVKLAPHMGPARRFNDGTLFVESIKSGESVRLKRAAESGEMLIRMFRLTIA